MQIRVKSKVGCEENNIYKSIQEEQLILCEGEYICQWEMAKDDRWVGEKEMCKPIQRGQFILWERGYRPRLRESKETSGGINRINWYRKDS